MHDYNEKAAILAVRYAMNIQPREKVVIIGSAVSNDFIRAIYIEILNAGGYPIARSHVPGINAAYYRYANEDQLKFINPQSKSLFEEFDVFIFISATTNSQETNKIDPQKRKISQNAPKSIELRKIRQEREAKGKLRQIVVPYPCDAFAQDAKMDTDYYKEFVYKALKLDEDNPVEFWWGFEKEQERIVQILNQVDQIQVLGEEIDFTFSVKERPWINSCGHKNLLDGKIFTSPIENSITGHIRFTYPGFYQGEEIKNIYLEFNEGKVVKGTAETGQELFDSVLATLNADQVIKFTIGTNHSIQKFTKNMLFDENMAGTMNLALFHGFSLIKSLKSENSKILADGKIIYQAGNWVI